MVELTHGGTWLKWSSLTPTDRRWALISFITSGLAAAPLGMAAKAWSYELGYRVGSGGLGQASSSDSILANDLFPYAMLGSALLALISAYAWWRFSRNQDEMFNRIQNYALGQAGGWTWALAFGWWTLSLGGWVPPLPLGWLILFGLALLFLFWFRGVRRWL